MDMWWHQPRLKEFPLLLPQNLLEVITRAYAIVEVGGLSGYGPERGRNFERLFYALCTRLGVNLCEKAGSRTLAHQQSASGFGHEVDGATRSVENITHWELKHLTTKLDKKEVMIFNGKGLDYFHGSSDFFAKVPILRFLLSGFDVGEQSRLYTVLWGIMLVEPRRFPLPLLYEAVARGAHGCLNPKECDVIKANLPWACRSLQSVLKELNSWGNGSTEQTTCGPHANRRVREVLAIQQELGMDVTDYLADINPEWIDDIANDTWNQVGGW